MAQHNSFFLLSYLHGFHFHKSCCRHLFMVYDVSRSRNSSLFRTKKVKKKQTLETKHKKTPWTFILLVYIWCREWDSNPQRSGDIPANPFFPFVSILALFNIDRIFGVLVVYYGPTIFLRHPPHILFFLSI
jgi:hypothetical protein